MCGLEITFFKYTWLYKLQGLQTNECNLAPHVMFIFWVHLIFFSWTWCTKQMRCSCILICIFIRLIKLIRLFMHMMPLYESASKSQFVAGTAFYGVYIYTIIHTFSFWHVCESVCVEFHVVMSKKPLLEPDKGWPLRRWYLLGLEHSATPRHNATQRDHGCSNKGGESAPINQRWQWTIKFVWTMFLFNMGGTSWHINNFLDSYFTSTCSGTLSF